MDLPLGSVALNISNIFIVYIFAERFIVDYVVYPLERISIRFYISNRLVSPNCCSLNISNIKYFSDVSHVLLYLLAERRNIAIVYRKAHFFEYFNRLKIMFQL